MGLCQSSGQGQSLEAAQPGLCNSALSRVPKDHIKQSLTLCIQAHVLLITCKITFQFYSNFSPSHAGLGGTPSISGKKGDTVQVVEKRKKG